jgi:hypothetical protein
MAATNEMRRSEKFVIGCLIAVLGMLFYVSWQVQPRKTGGPKLSGVTLEWTVTVPNKEPVKIIHQLEVGETKEQWQQKLRELIEGVTSFKE